MNGDDGDELGGGGEGWRQTDSTGASFGGVLVLAEKKADGRLR